MGQCTRSHKLRDLVISLIMLMIRGIDIGERQRRAYAPVATIH
jgi:hypothetical protein